MTDFTITTRLTRKEYIKVMYLGLYKKPNFIIITFMGLYLVTTVMLDYFNIINYYTDTPFFEIMGGIFLLIFPTLIVMLAVRQFMSNPSLRNDMIYTFSDKGVTIEGLSFKTEFLWVHLVKQKELGNFLILYHNKKFGNFIEKTKLTPEQLQFIKSKISKR